MHEIIAAVAGFIFAALIFIAMYAISWGIVVGLLKLIGLCFGFSISLATATGVWLGLCLVKYILRGLRKRDNE